MTEPVRRVLADVDKVAEALAEVKFGYGWWKCWADDESPANQALRDGLRAMAVAAIETLGLTEAKQTIPVFVDDDPPELVWHGLEQVPARHAVFIPHTHLHTVWHSDECPDCQAEYGIHDRRQAEDLAAMMEQSASSLPWQTGSDTP